MGGRLRAQEAWATGSRSSAWTQSLRSSMGRTACQDPGCPRKQLNTVWGRLARGGMKRPHFPTQADNAYQISTRSLASGSSL